MNAQTKDQRDHWRDQIAALTAQIETAEGAAEDARSAASTAALEGGGLDKATRALAHARDVLDALRSAKGEAERRLAKAEADHAQRERDRALAHAQSIARKRIEAADRFDAYARELDPALAEWVGAGNAYAREVRAAGMRPPGAEARDYRLRAALWATAPAFMAAIGAARVNVEHRATLREITASQSAPVLAKGD
jgi:hypothetical protein